MWKFLQTRSRVWSGIMVLRKRPAFLSGLFCAEACSGSSEHLESAANKGRLKEMGNFLVELCLLIRILY